MNASIEQLLSTARVAISNALEDSDILVGLAPYGYDTARLQAGALLQNQAAQLHQQQQQAYGRQIQATKNFNRLWKQAKARYQVHLRIARNVLGEEPDAMRSLLLEGERRRTYAGWFLQADHFYKSLEADPALQARLQTAGLTPRESHTAQTLLQNVSAARAHKDLRRGEAQAATRQRQQAHQSLKRWLANFIKIARIALADAPAALVKLGMVTPARTKVSNNAEANTENMGLVVP